MLTFDPARVRELCRKNASDSHGLTIVAGLPFPREITAAIASVQRRIEDLLPNRFQWYGLDHLHASIYAPLRSQDRPLRRDDLPPDLEGFVRDLGDAISRWQPFTLTFAGARLGQDGALIMTEDTLERQLISHLSNHPRTAAPKHARGLAIVAGFLTTAEPFTSDREGESFEQELASLRDLEIGSIEVEQVWLASYCHRTLSRLHGRLAFELGRVPSDMSATDLLAALGIDG